MGCEVSAIEIAEKREGNRGGVFVIESRHFRIIVPECLRERAVADIEECLERQVDVLVETQSWESRD
jgi:hypothetical protein